MHAVVIGAGIGGLAAAIGLRRAGWDVTVLERAPELGEIGAGISLWSNALRALEELRVADDIRALGTMSGQGGVRTPKGRWLARSSGERMAARDDVSLLMVHRAELHARLVAAAPAVTLGADVYTVDGDAVGYRTADGEHTVHADLIVGADGIRSRVRQLVHPSAPPPRYTGFTAWRGVTTERFTLDQQSETLGSGAEFGLVQLMDGRAYWFGTGNEAEGMSATDEHAEVLRRFGSWHAPIAEVVRATAPESVLRHDVYQLARPLSAFAVGRVALLGDAAHACTPNLGQGACQALEDAVTLAAEAAAVSEPADVPAALARYDAARRPRTQAISLRSDRVHRVMQARNRVGLALRTMLITAIPPRFATAGIAKMIDWTPPRIGG